MFADIVDVATKAGTLPMQVLMLAAILGLGIVFRKFYKDSNEELRQLGARFDVREASMTTERISRINMLMDIIKEDTVAKTEMVHAVENNTSAIRDLRELVNEQRDFIHNAVQKISR